MRVDRISDQYINIERSLEGFDSNRSYWTTHLLNSTPSATQWEIIDAFKFRVRELVENIVDLRLPKIHQINIQRLGQGARVHAYGYPSKHRAKSLFLDFRHFTSNDEPANFNKVCNTIMKIIGDEKSTIFLRSMKKNWLNCNWEDGDFIDSTVTAKILFRVWFNTQYFHSGRIDQIEEKEKILTNYDDETIRMLLVMSIVEARKYLIWVYCIVKDLEKEYELRYYLPDEKQIHGKIDELFA